MKPVDTLTDEELFDELREQVNRSRNLVGHDRTRTKAIAEEMKRRGWSRSTMKRIEQLEGDK